LRDKALGAMVTDVFFTWPSAVTIALTIIAFFSKIELFAGWQPWYWVIVGAVLEVIYMVATLSDPKARQAVVSNMLSEKFDPRDVKNIYARQQVQKALEYKHSIDTFVNRQTGPLRTELEQTSNEIESWVAQIYRLARSIDTFDSNAIIRRDRIQAPTELAALERRLKVTTDPAVRAELERAIEAQRQLADDLQRVANQGQRMEIKMQTTVAQMSTIYAKLQLLDAKELDGSRARRIQDEIHDEVSSLNDLIDAMSDIQTSGTASAALSRLATEDDSASSDSATSSRQSTAKRS